MDTTRLTDWQVSHEENQGRTTVVMDMNTDPDDSAGLHICVKGSGHAAFAVKLAELLQQHGIVPTA